MSGIAIPLCVIPVSLRHIVSDPRAQVARPAPAGRVTRARGSLTISEKKTEISDFETEKCHIWLVMNTRFRLRGEDRNFQ